MKLSQHWLIWNNICGCGLFCETICDWRNAEREPSTVAYMDFPLHKNTTVAISLQINATFWWQWLKSSQNGCRSDWHLSQPGWICDVGLFKECELQLDIKRLWVQVHSPSLNPQPLIKEFPRCDLRTVCLHQCSYWWTSADTKSPGPEQIMACFTETKTSN